ncbi:MAG: hypothetical protein HZB38_12485 [Planctomycetes bacterium]|nr:hypothetical protein [Planctomycetota bacterium]
MSSDLIDLGSTALAGLLEEYRAGRIFDASLERAAMQRHAAALTQRWNSRFPGFPDHYFRFTSLRGLHHRGKRDAYLRDIIVQQMSRDVGQERTIVNPACVFGRHARDLARRLREHRLIAIDIDPGWNRLYSILRPGRTPGNYRFVQGDIFDLRLDVQPVAVVFFGACGALSDAAMDLAIRSEAPRLMGRTCCHENIAGNTLVTRRRGAVNRFFRFKNRVLRWMRARPRFGGFYFSSQYAEDRYPRSDAAKRLTTSQELIAAGRDSTDSDVCRAIIDLDRFLYLCEAGFDVWYQGELFVAERRG